MKTETFNNGLVVKSRKHAIILENSSGKKERESKFIFDFNNKEDFIEFVGYIKKVADESWVNIVPKEADSMGSDYDEYYDRRYDDNGYLSVNKYKIVIHAPYWSVDTLYQFNKPKIQSFLYDVDKIINLNS